MENLDFKEILIKKPFFNVSPFFYPKQEMVMNKRNAIAPDDKVFYDIRTQEDMLREYYPTGHKIRNKDIYPDILKQDPETKKWYVQPITRCTLAMQQIIATKHIIHLIGNDVQFELSDFKINKKSRENMNVEEIAKNDSDNELLSSFKKGWLDKNLEIRFYEAVRSIKITGDGAVVGYFKDKKLYFKTLSFLNDDVLYPHYDNITGDLTLFARKYYDYDESGTATTEWVEVWDETYMYRAKRGVGDNKEVSQKIKEFFGITGYTIVDTQKHGFNKVPVAYYRDDDGACWSNAQDTIEKYEEALSYFFENNKAFAFPILVVQGDGVELNGDEITGAVKSITIDSTDGNAHFLEGNDVSSSYKALLETMYKMIYEQAFAVKPPELKSGDLPGVALKLLYSPAIERAIQDSHNMQPFVDKLVWMVKYGWGIEQNNQASLLVLGINAWIEPYVHQNDTEITTNLSTAVQNRIISMQTASERLAKYAKNDEFDRIIREQKWKDEQEINKANVEKTHATDEEIRKVKQTAGQDVNTGGGAGNGRERNTDKWGNREGENNWGDWNTKH